MSFSSHAKELRNRLVVSFIIIIVFFLICYSRSGQIISWIKNSINLPGDVTVVFISPAEALWSNLTVSIYCSVIVSFPFILFQIWKFFSPALLERERKFISIMIFSSLTLLMLGLCFAILFVIPFSINFLVGYKTEDVIPYISIGSIIDFYVKFSLTFALIFELPLVITLLSKTGILSPAFLKRNRKYAMLVFFIFAAIITPTTDVINQLLLAVPLIILYEVGIISANLVYKNK